MNGAADSNAKPIFHSNARKEHTNKWILPTPQKETFEAKGARERERDFFIIYSASRSCICVHETKQFEGIYSIQLDL